MLHLFLHFTLSIPLLLQAAPDPAAVASAAQALRQQSGQTTEMLRDYGALVNLLYLLAIAGGLSTVAALYWIIRKGDTFAASVQATCASLLKPLEDAYKLASAERSEKHAQEIRANEANHQAQLRAMEKQLEAKDKQIEASNDERRQIAETANNAYREMTEVLSPFTQSNHAVAGRLHDVERIVSEFGSRLNQLIPKP